MRHSIRTAVVALVAVLALAACGDDDPTGPEFPQVIEEVEFHPLLDIDLSEMTKTASGLYYQDVTVGQGAQPEAGDSVFVNHVGYLTDGTQFSSGPFQYVAGAGEVIPGFDEAVLGMRAGGTRKMVLPPELGYGSQGAGPIPGGAVLIFDVFLDRVVKGPF